MVVFYTFRVKCFQFSPHIVMLKVKLLIYDRNMFLTGGGHLVDILDMSFLPTYLNLSIWNIIPRFVNSKTVYTIQY